jgi:uncharacterized protein YdaU (DUF1376 family)
MAERWQQWYPHHIDNWQGSANVQALSDLAYRAIHNLLQDMWKQSDCSLPNDDRDLAKRSRVANRWAECREEVMEYFEVVEGRVTHSFLRREWAEAGETYRRNQDRKAAVIEAKKAAGKAGAEKRWHSDSKPIAPAIANDALTETGTETTTETKAKNKQKPSRSREVDPRHEGFKAAVMSYGAYKRVKLPWGPGEGNQLALLLKSAPDLTLLEFQQCLTHRARSEGVPHGDRPMSWLPNILRYQQGPLNAFNRTEETHGKPTKSTLSVQTAEDALGILRAGRVAAAEGYDGRADH